jgi:hypothetical protein
MKNLIYFLVFTMMYMMYFVHLSIFFVERILRYILTSVYQYNYYIDILPHYLIYVNNFFIFLYFIFFNIVVNIFYFNLSNFGIIFKLFKFSYQKKIDFFNF